MIQLQRIALDIDMKIWPIVRDGNWLGDILDDDAQVKTWQKTFESVYNRTMNTTWDYQWTFACWIENGLTAIPNDNLISNIGFGVGATHQPAPCNLGLRNYFYIRYWY